MTGAKTSNLQQNADFRVLTHSYVIDNNTNNLQNSTQD